MYYVVLQNIQIECSYLVVWIPRGLREKKKKPLATKKTLDFINLTF